MASALEPTISRAPYAANPALTRGRLVAEPASATRNDFQRDRDRIVHCTAFRRLGHKTQVFVHHEGDHFRTRLTHTIEVAQIARALAKGLALDEDLAEAVALGHDLGHTPFGHTGEDALDDCMAAYGGFDHNAQALRIVCDLERRYADFDGLNLVQETLEGLVKHNGPMIDAAGRPLARYADRGIPAIIAAYDRRQSLELSLYASLEAQCAALADDIAYNAHDIDDGLRAGLFSLEELSAIPSVRALRAEIASRHPGLEAARVIHEIGRRLITRAIEDALRESRARIGAAGVAGLSDIRRAGRALIGFSAEMAAADAGIKPFLFTHMYRHPNVARVREKADGVIRRLFQAFHANPNAMPPDWAMRAQGGAPERVIADYIAGMTDRYALHEYQRLFDQAPDMS